MSCELGDIEDGIKDLGAFLPQSSKQENCVRVRSVKQSTIPCDVNADSFIPGTKVVFMRTWGCSHNNSDSEYMAGLLQQAGYTITSSESAGDVWLLNSCTVKTPSEAQLHRYVQRGLDAGKCVVVGGCVSQGAPDTDWLRGLSIVGVQQIDRVVEVVEETLKGNTVRLLAPKRQGRSRLGGAPLSLPKIRKNKLIEILAINTGCLNHCTYCKTKHARGDLASYPVDELVARAKEAFAEGVKELWLTSEDLGAYGHDLDIRLPDLLHPLVEVIPEGCMMRLGMTNPPYILDHLEDIAKILNHPRVYSFLHIPVQAGCDRVLDDMRREYTRADFCRVVDFMLERVPGVTIATDIICGFPTESAEDFDETMTLVEKYRFPSLFINQYFPRPGTASARMKRVDTAEVKRRTRMLSELFKSFSPYGPDRVGRTYTILITEEAKDGRHYVGHNKSYEQILVPKQPELMGQTVEVKITTVTRFSMIGHLSTGSNSTNFIQTMFNVGLARQLTGLKGHLINISQLRTLLVVLFAIVVIRLMFLFH